MFKLVLKRIREQDGVLGSLGSAVGENRGP